MGQQRKVIQKKRSRQAKLVKKQLRQQAPFQLGLFRVAEGSRLRSGMPMRDRLFVLKIVGNVLRGTGNGLHVMATAEQPRVTHEHVVMGSSDRMQRIRTKQGTLVRQSALSTTYGAPRNRTSAETEPLPLQFHKTAPGRPWIVTNPNNGMRAVEITPTLTTLKLALGFRE